MAVFSLQRVRPLGLHFEEEASLVTVEDILGSICVEDGVEDSSFPFNDGISRSSMSLTGDDLPLVAMALLKAGQPTNTADKFIMAKLCGEGQGTLFEDWTIDGNRARASTIISKNQ